MLLQSFMKEHYPNLLLRPPLFYRANVGIRFELGHFTEGVHTISDARYLQGSYERARLLFEALHAPEDEIFIVMDVWHDEKGTFLTSKLKNYRRYVAKEWLFKLNVQTIALHEEEGSIERFSLKCRTSDVQYSKLLKDICRQDLGMQPNLFHPVYVINMRTNTLFYVYDDRGCDVVATSVETLRPIYERYNEWILAYDRAQIDGLFNV